jgi:hypothetical protein
VKIPSEAELIEMERQYDLMPEIDSRHTEDFRLLISLVRDYVQTEQQIAARYEAEFGRAV